MHLYLYLLSNEFCDKRPSIFSVILLTNKQSNKPSYVTNADENIILLAEVKVRMSRYGKRNGRRLVFDIKPDVIDNDDHRQPARQHLDTGQFHFVQL